MKKALLASVLCIGIVSPLGADDTLVRFDGGIGVIPVSNVTVNADGSITVSRNIVRGVNPPGRPLRSAISPAMVASAISAGVCDPMSSPMGRWTRGLASV